MDEESQPTPSNPTEDTRPTAGGPAEEPWADDERLTVPVSAIEHYSYCPRQCALVHVERTFDDNVYTVRGHLAHERVDSGEDDVAEGVTVLRGVRLWSERLGLSGKADVVELRPEGAYPVEYKSGRRRGAHADYQLCAQALCLEEMMGEPVPRGALFYVGARRRHEVAFTPTLRQQTEQLVSAVHELLLAQRVPPPVNDARCQRCAQIDICLPDVVGEPARLRGLQGALYIPARAQEDDDA